MPWTFLFAAIIAIGAVVLVIAAFDLRRRSRKPDFWKLAARYPDNAYDWFVTHDCWTVVDPESATAKPFKPGTELDGPHILWVPKLGGRRVAVYGRRQEMEESQRAFVTVYGFDEYV